MAKEKLNIYKDCKVICACGATFDTKSTKDEIHVEVCSECHPRDDCKEPGPSRGNERTEIRLTIREICDALRRHERICIHAKRAHGGRTPREPSYKRLVHDALPLPRAGHGLF